MRALLSAFSLSTAALATAAAVVGCSSAQRQPGAERAARAAVEPRPELAWAMAAAEWLHRTAVETEHGLAWPADPERPGELPTGLPTDLYHGSAGVVLFLAEAHRVAGGDARLLADVTAGADHLLGTLPEVDGDSAIDASLYTGVAGVGFALWEAFRATGAARFERGARRCVDLVHRSARAAGARGVEWNDTTDIIRGGAGIGLFLQYAAREMDHAPSSALARRAGWRLVELGEPVDGGRKWAMRAGFARNYPNFSHGTAGVCYFLAALYREAGGERAFLDAALDGASYLESLECDGLVLHHEPGGEDLFYLGWCHGPPGTTRLFWLLGEVTGDERWQRAVERAARAVRQSGIPERRTPGLWNNVGQCCGTAGVGEMFLTFPGVADGDERAADLAFCRRIAEDLATRATRDADGARWVHAEHRVRPDQVGAQTGYMQGAAGIGLFFLHLDGALRGRAPMIVFPDAPRGRTR